MSLRAIPLIIIPFIIYNVIALLGGDVPADDIFRKPLFNLPMLSGARWTFSASESSSAMPPSRTTQGTGAVFARRFCFTSSSSAR